MTAWPKVADRILAALKKTPDLTATQVCDVLGVKPAKARNRVRAQVRGLHRDGKLARRVGAGGEFVYAHPSARRRSIVIAPASSVTAPPRPALPAGETVEEFLAHGGRIERL